VQALLQELSFASYLDVHTVILPPPRSRARVTSYARALGAALARVPYMQLSVRLPIYDPSIFRHPPASPPHTPDASTPEIRVPPARRATEAELNAMWEMWDAVRALCAYDPRLTLSTSRSLPAPIAPGADKSTSWPTCSPYRAHIDRACPLTALSAPVALDLTPPLPSVPGVLARWAAEPIRHVFLPASTFIANAKGYPVLPKGSQTFIKDIMKVRVPLPASPPFLSWPRCIHSVHA
jgi:protein arginine N-methyltransferase 5